MLAPATAGRGGIGATPTGARVGEMFGRYRLEHRLGAGGVGEVWRAVDTSLDRVVALKMLLARFRDDPDSAARFHREARLAAGLRHPHIVRVHTFGEIDRRLFLDMELVEGESLAAAVAAGGPFDHDRVADVVARVADALDTAHGLDGPPERRMVHRDVKPANVLVEPRPHGREHVYLVDFGVARTVAAGTVITGVGSVVGTPAYMAPELWEGRETDHRVDVYALAVTAFELLTGRLPFPRSSLEGLLTAHLTEPVPRASQVHPGVPAALDPVLARGMAKDPDRRHATAGDLAAALSAALRPARAATGAGTRPATVPAPVPRATAAPSAPPRSGPSAPAGGGPARSGQPGAGPPRSGRPAGGVARSGPSAPDPGPPDARAAGPGAPAPPPGPAPYLASPPHFAGLATTALLLPLYLAGLVRADWTLLVAFVLLYALGAVVVAVLRPRRP